MSWKIGGVSLGLVFFAAVLFVQPVGVSTQFVIADAIVWDAIDGSLVTATPDVATAYTSTNPYLAESGGRYAAEVAEPLNYGIVFVLAIVLGALLSALLRGGVSRSERKMPAVWRANFGDAPAKRWLTAFGAGFVVLYGARLAGGCTSGHMMSGMMQTAVSGFVFTVAAFATAVPTALAMYRKGM